MCRPRGKVGGDDLGYAYLPDDDDDPGQRHRRHWKAHPEQSLQVVFAFFTCLKWPPDRVEERFDYLFEHSKGDEPCCDLKELGSARAEAHSTVISQSIRTQTI